MKSLQVQLDRAKAAKSEADDDLAACKQSLAATEEELDMTKQDALRLSKERDAMQQELQQQSTRASKSAEVCKSLDKQLSEASASASERERDAMGLQAQLKDL